MFLERKKKHEHPTAVHRLDMHHIAVSYISRVMRKPDIFAYAKTKAQISCAVTAKLISAFVFDTGIVQFLLYLYLKFQLLCQTWPKTPKTGFSRSGSYVTHLNQSAHVVPLDE